MRGQLGYGSALGFTGVNLIIDDTPEAVLLSCFDPVRREVGRLALERLVLDGRIHPQRIEEAYEQSKAEVEQLCVRAGEEDALVELAITDLHPELVTLLGRLRYRTSYGQNVLRHLVESAFIAGIAPSTWRTAPRSSSRSATCVNATWTTGRAGRAQCGGWSSACVAPSSASGWNAAAPNSCRPSRTSCARR